MTLFNKELLEKWRNLQWIWVPLVFILLSIMDPITTYYMPQILESLGGMPEGAVFEMPTPSPSDAMMMSLAQLSSLGVLVIVLMSMGTISGEVKSGTAELILAKPVSSINYVTAKWGAFLCLILISFVLGMLMSWYYTVILFGKLSFSSFLFLCLFYGLWLAFVVSLSIFYNALSKIPGMVAFLTIATVILLSLITQLFGNYLLWSPANLSFHINHMLIFSEVSMDLMMTGLITILTICLLLVSAVNLFKSKEIGQ